MYGRFMGCTNQAPKKPKEALASRGIERPNVVEFPSMGHMLFAEPGEVQCRAGKTTAIRRTAVRESGVSQSNHGVSELP